MMFLLFLLLWSLLSTRNFIGWDEWFFQLDRVLVYGYQGAEHHPEKLALNIRLLNAVLAEALVVCVGQNRWSEC